MYVCTLWVIYLKHSSVKSAAHILYQYDAIVGIMFEKDKGQHILKNPLVVNSMVEKVCVYVFVCVCVCVCVCVHVFIVKISFLSLSVLSGCPASYWYCIGGGAWYWQYDCKATRTDKKGTLAQVFNIALGVVTTFTNDCLLPRAIVVTYKYLEPVQMLQSGET